MDFGKVLIGGIGYGFAVLMVLGALMCAVDVQRAKSGTQYSGTKEDNLRWFIANLLLGFVAAVVTRTVLGLL